MHTFTHTHTHAHAHTHAQTSQPGRIGRRVFQQAHDVRRHDVIINYVVCIFSGVALACRCALISVLRAILTLYAR